MKAAVIGAGAWGTTLAKILAENGHNVVIWSHDALIAEQINKQHENIGLFPGFKLPENITSTVSLEEAAKSADLVVLVVASKFYAATVKNISPFLSEQTVIVSATKGLDPGTNRRTSEIMLENLPENLRKNSAVLSGPNIAKEIAVQKPATTVIASLNPETAKKAQAYFSTKYFRVYTNDDIIGAEIGGTLKNIIAIAAGIVDGLQLGDNARSSLMVRGMAEIIRFGTHFGAKPDTFFGLAGMGDLITTCSSVMSRNHYVGENLAKGRKLSEILAGMTAVAEGVETAKHVRELAIKENIVMPVTEQVYQVLFEDKPVQQAILDLMTRDLKSEKI